MWKAVAVCWLTSGILNKSTVSELRKVPCDDLCGDGESFTEYFDDVSPVLSVEILRVVLGSVVIAAKVIYCVIYLA